MTDDLKSKFWVFKSVPDEDRSYKSIRAYDDDLTSRYNYDSNVANCRQVKEGDIALIINKEHILGIARISAIEISHGTKTIMKCPTCGSTNFEERKTKHPKFRCNKKHEFEILTSTTQDVTRYSALYASSYMPVRRIIDISLLRSYYTKGYNRNMSIQAISSTFWESNFQLTFQSLINGERLSLPAFEACLDNESGNNYDPNDLDERKRIHRQIKARRGQAKFRNALRARYGDQCMVTGCKILDILEAAHINSYKGEKDNHALNGLLLRSDIHTLFDLNLMGIKPDTLTVHFSRRIQDNGYGHYHNATLFGCDERKRPSSEALSKKWSEFIETNEME